MHESESDDDFNNICPICERVFESMAGIKMHWAKGHTVSEIQTAINNKTQTVTSAAGTSAAQASQPAVSFTQQAPPNISQPSSQSSSDTLRNRVNCSTCGFLAKNERGLKVHYSRSHNTQQRIQPSSSTSHNLTHQIDIDSLDEATLIRKFGELLYKCKCSIPLVRIIQKSVRTIVCQELAKVVEFAATKNNIFAWFRLLSFPHIVLNTISNNCFKDNHRPNIVCNNLNVFSKLNDIPSLFNALLNLLSIERPKKAVSHAEKLLIKIAQRKISEGDIGGAVRVLCYQEGIADYTPETIEKLKAKHPDENDEIEEEVIPNLEPFETSSDQITNSIKHFPISSSSGIDGLRPRHLKDLISFSCGDSSTKLTSAAAKLVDVIRSGKICPSFLPVFYGAALIALAKKNGDIRPIAIGLTWRRLAGKIACFSIKDDLAQKLATIQNGFGIKGGAEAIVHAVRAFAQVNQPIPMAIIKFDYKNAFNELFRRFMLNGIKTDAPSLFPMMQQAYRCPSDLHYGDIFIQSKRGTQQGDPYASAAFCIALNRLTRSLSSRLYADAQLEMLQKLNQLLPGIKVINASSFQLLGAPIMEDSLSLMLSTGLENVIRLCKLS